MTSNKYINTFALKWIKKFNNPNINFIELVDHYLADDCVELSFEMDCGKAFSDKYGNAFNDIKELERVINNITDIPLLGSAVYSKWRYFNHWAYDAASILEPKNRSWFITVLERLEFLTRSNLSLFKGKLKKMRIVSNNICFGPCPEPNDDTEQHLTINSDGRVWFSSYTFGDGINNHTKSTNDSFSIDKNVASKILDKVESYFSNDYYDVFATDIGYWEMELTNFEDETFKFKGSLCSDFEVDGVDLSDLIRDTLNMQNLFVFDGNNKPDIINRISLDYHRLTKIYPNEILKDSMFEYVTWDYTEHLIIDRETETLEHIQNIGSGCKVSRKYEIQDGINNLLDSFDGDSLFEYIEDNPNDVVETPNNIIDYQITIDYKKKPRRIITGTFDKNALPDDFGEFAETILEFIHFYGIGEILNPTIYSKPKRRKTDYIYCSVIFEEDGKSYYYITDDDNIDIGDYVLVPVGTENCETIVKVVDIEYFDKKDVPLPVERTKRIIRKCTEEDFDIQEGIDLNE